MYFCVKLNEQNIKSTKYRSDFHSGQFRRRFYISFTLVKRRKGDKEEKVTKGRKGDKGKEKVTKVEVGSV